MTAESVKHASCLAIASVVILTSLFSLKGLTNVAGLSKIEEETILHNNNIARSKMQKPEKKRDSRVRAYFVLCRNCFWCTSQMRIEDNFEKCLVCKSEELETFPICLGESFFFDCSSRNINLAFRKD